MRGSLKKQEQAADVKANCPLCRISKKDNTEDEDVTQKGKGYSNSAFFSSLAKLQISWLNRDLPPIQSRRLVTALVITASILLLHQDF